MNQHLPAFLTAKDQGVIANDAQVAIQCLLGRIGFSPFPFSFESLDGGINLVQQITIAVLAGCDFYFHAIGENRPHPDSAALKAMLPVRQWSAKQDDDLTVVVCDYVCA